jgi:hypothetical protein
MDLSGPGIDVKLKERKKERKKLVDLDKSNHVHQLVAFVGKANWTSSMILMHLKEGLLPSKYLP